MNSSDQRQNTETVSSYTDADIRSLNSLEHIQLRPGMYIGRMGNGEHPDDGIYILLKEVIDNAIDEFSAGFGKTIDITVEDNKQVTVRDYGRGIPLNSVVDCVSKINTGGKFRRGEDGKPAPFACSIGLNGVGLKATTALSETFTVISRREGKSVTAIFSNGKLVSQKKAACKEPSGTEIQFRPSEKFFPGFSFDTKHILPRKIANYSWLNVGLAFNFNGQRYCSRRGLLDLLDSKLGDEDNSLYTPIHHRSENLEFAFLHTGSFDERYYSFANGQYTNDGGTHLSAFKEGILKAINEVSPKKIDAADVRTGIYGVISVRVIDPHFESQTKNRLGNAEIRGPIVNEVSKAILEVLYKNPDIKQKILDKIQQNEELRTKLAAVRKDAKEQAKKVALRIPKLKDCRFHLNDAENRKKPEEKEKCHNSMLFLAEGDSAANNLYETRDTETQAVFPLRGKCLNCCQTPRDKIFKNEELFFVTQALGVENNLDNLRYSKIIIASDADVDGFHIRNLITTFFLTLYPSLVLSNHLFVLETPLYRVRDPRRKEKKRKKPASPADGKNTKKKGEDSQPEEPANYYCYNDQERDEAVKKIGKHAEITRFKGLGEINRSEFRPLIANGTMRLLPVTVDVQKDVDSILKFYMGGNTPNRRDYIMKHILADITI